MRVLLNLVNDNKIIGANFSFIFKNKTDIESLIDIDIDELFIVIGPCSYTNARKSIAIGKALEITRKIKIFGIDLLSDFMSLFSDKCIFQYGNHIWIKENGECSVKIFDQEESFDGFISNIELKGVSSIVDCSSEKIFLNLENLKNPLRQSYFDKFSQFK